MDLSTIAPVNTVAVTASSQPALYWHVSQIPACTVFFTLTTDDMDLPLVEKRMSVQSVGLQEIRLADLGVNLAEGITYRWFVSVVPDLQRRSRDLISGALIRFERGSAEAWYDRVSSVIRSAESTSADQEFHTLLRDAGLGDLLGRQQIPHRH